MKSLMRGPMPDEASVVRRGLGRLSALATNRSESAASHQRSDQGHPARSLQRARQAGTPEAQYEWLVVAAHHAGAPLGLPGVRPKRGGGGDHPVPISYMSGGRIDRAGSTPYIANPWHYATS